MEHHNHIVSVWHQDGNVKAKRWGAWGITCGKEVDKVGFIPIGVIVVMVKSWKSTPCRGSYPQVIHRHFHSYYTKGKRMGGRADVVRELEHRGVRPEGGTSGRSPRA